MLCVRASAALQSELDIIFTFTSEAQKVSCPTAAATLQRCSLPSGGSCFSHAQKKPPNLYDEHFHHVPAERAVTFRGLPQSSSSAKTWDECKRLLEPFSGRWLFSFFAAALFLPSQSHLAPRPSLHPSCSGAGDDYGPLVRRGVLRRHRHGPRVEVPQGSGAGGLL